MPVRDNIIGSSGSSSEGRDIIDISNTVRKTVASNCSVNTGDFVRYVAEDVVISNIIFGGLYSLETEYPSEDEFKDNSVVGVLEEADTYRRLLYLTNAGRSLGGDILYDVKAIILNYKFSTGSITVVGSKNIVIGSTRKIRFSEIKNVDTNKCLVALTYSTSSAASMNLYTFGVSSSTPVYAEKKQVISSRGEYNYPSFIHQINTGVYLAYYAGDNSCTLVVPAGSESIPKIDTYGTKSNFFSFLGTNRRMTTLDYFYDSTDSMMVLYSDINISDIGDYKSTSPYDLKVSYNTISAYTTTVSTMTSASQISMVESVHADVLEDIQGVNSIDSKLVANDTILLAYQYQNSTTTLVSAYIKYNKDNSSFELLKGSAVFSDIEYSIKDIRLISAKNKIIHITLSNGVRYIMQYKDNVYPNLAYDYDTLYKTNESSTLLSTIGGIVEYTTTENTFTFIGLQDTKIGYTINKYNYTTEPKTTDYIDKTFYKKITNNAGIEEVSYEALDYRLYMKLPKASSLQYTSSQDGVANSLYENASRFKSPKVYYDDFSNIHLVGIVGGDTGTGIYIGYKRLSYTDSGNINTKFTHNSLRVISSVADTENIEYDISVNSADNPIVLLHTPDNTVEIHVIKSTSSVDTISMAEKNTKKDLNYIFPFGNKKAVIIGDKTITLLYYNSENKLSYNQISAPGNILYAKELSTKGSFAILYIDSNNNTIFKTYRVPLSATTLESGLLEGVPVTITGYTKAGLIIPLDNNYDTTDSIAVLTSTTTDLSTKASMRVMTMKKLNADSITSIKEVDIYLSTKNEYQWINDDTVQILSDNTSSNTIDSTREYVGNVLHIFDSNTIVSSEHEYYSSGIGSYTGYSDVSLISLKNKLLLSTASIKNNINNISEYGLFFADLVKSIRRSNDSEATISITKSALRKHDEYTNITDKPIGVALESGITGDIIEIALNG